MPAPRAKTVGAYAAKTHLPALLEEVAKGGEIIITKHNRPIAKLVPVQPPWPDAGFFERLRAFRRKHRLPKGETVKDLINAGRRI